MLVAIQPPRGYGEDPVGIYHDPELPPTHHYLACYRWLDAVWGADAIVHLGKHGTLEWLPGKMLALSSACAPDAALGDVPLVYPFVVNDPGEGVQAKRRAHAVIVDHLVPPMMRADTYDELAELEALLDEYARLEVLDPPKLPALAARIWSAIERANLQADLDVHERPDDFGELVQHIDGYLCEVKDIQIKDGLHVLGQAPEGEQLRGLVAALLRLGSGEVPGLRAAVGAAFGLDEPALVAAPGAGGGCGRARGALPRARGQRGGPRRPPGGRADGAARRAGRVRLGRRAVARVCAEVLGRSDRRRRAGAAVRRAGGRAAPAPDRRGAHSTCSRRCTGATSPRARRAARPAGGSTCCRRGATSTRSTRARCPRSSRGRSASASRRRCWSATAARRGSAAHGRAGRVGHLGDAHPGRRRRRDPRAARRAPDVARRVAARHGDRGDRRCRSSAGRGST